MKTKAGILAVMIFLLVVPACLFTAVFMAYYAWHSHRLILGLVAPLWLIVAGLWFKMGRLWHSYPP